MAAISIKNTAEEAVIDIEGIIGVPEDCQFPDGDSRVATWDKFRGEIAKIAEITSPLVVVNIRSTGGDVNAALLIYEALRGLDSRVVTRCFGYTASAATVIAQAASDGGREISSTSLYLIHHAMMHGEGNSYDMAKSIETLKATDKTLLSLYSSRSGRSVDEIAELMDANNGNGRWIAPDEVIAAGLADSVIQAKEKIKQPINQIFNSMSKFSVLARSVLSRIRGEAERATETESGTLYHESETLGVGDEVFIKDTEGNLTPAPDGDYPETQGDRTYIVSGGSVAEVKTKEPEGDPVQPVPAPGNHSDETITAAVELVGEMAEHILTLEKTISQMAERVEKSDGALATALKELSDLQDKVKQPIAKPTAAKTRAEKGTESMSRTEIFNSGRE